MIISLICRSVRYLLSLIWRWFLHYHWYMDLLIFFFNLWICSLPVISHRRFYRSVYHLSSLFFSFVHYLPSLTCRSLHLLLPLVALIISLHWLVYLCITSYLWFVDLFLNRYSLFRDFFFLSEENYSFHRENLYFLCSVNVLMEKWKCKGCYFTPRGTNTVIGSWQLISELMSTLSIFCVLQTPSICPSLPGSSQAWSLSTHPAVTWAEHRK